MKKPVSAKERGLIKGALRRVFSRSELRREALSHSIREGYYDADRPRVKKWSKCEDCSKWEPTYLMQVDHIEPVIPIDSSLEDMTWDQLVDRLWCDITNLNPICKDCHKRKSKQENKERRQIKKLRGNKK